jgi:cellulose synthase/poly-beta-1,6-N-acetylglucosamine synthase-like glycosyltransferase
MTGDIFLITAVIAYCLCAGALFLYGLNCYVMIYLFLRGRKRQQAEDRQLLDRFEATKNDEDLPIITTQLPLYNEKFVVERLLRAVCAFDYPATKHEIQVLDDSNDESFDITARLVAELRAEGHDIHHIHRTNREGYKAGALAEGMRVARGEYFAIFDADFVPPPDFLRRTVPFLVEEPGIGFVQTRWGHRNRYYSVLTMAQSIGIDGHFVVEQSARAWNGLFLNFNGTAGVWRRKAIEEAGGWSADTITEDLDLSYRAQLEGWRGRFLFDVVTPAEIPTNINAFKSQQHRWAKGSIQTALKLLPKVLKRRDVAPFKKLQAVLHLTHYLVHPIIFTMVLLVLPLLVWGQAAFRPFVIIPLLTLMVVSMVAPSTLYVFSQRVAYPDWKSKLKFLPALMVLGMGLAVNNSLGVLSAIFRRRDYGVFVRTPKLGQLAEHHGFPLVPQKVAAEDPKKDPRVSRLYRIPLNRLFLMEAFMGIWALAAFAQYLHLYKFIIGPILLLHAIGFLYVGITSVVHDNRAKRLET